MLLLNNISKQYVGQVILKSVTLPLSKKRTALVGMNGSGKTTLMKIIAGLEYPDTGEVTSKKETVVEYMPQQAAYDFKGTVFEEVSAWLDSDKLLELLKREASLIKAIENSDLPDDSTCIELAEVVEKIHLLEVEAKKKNSVETILLNLGFPKDEWDKPASTLSGGWQMRVALARVLVKEPDIILLDEPTNYLDIATIDFLADWIMKFAGKVLLVSHDRDFLNRIVEETWEVFSGDLNVYRGNYDFYLSEKEVRLKVLEKQREKQLDDIRALNDFYEKNRTNAATASLAQSKFKQMEKLKNELIALPKTPLKMNFKLPEPKRGGEKVVELNNIYHSFGDLSVIADYKRIISRRERIALIGRNGFGKSTLMNIIGGDLEPASGECHLGKDIEVSYFRQHETTLLPADESVLGFVESIASFEMMPKVKTLLGCFLFYEDDWDKKIGVLSGGEKVRLAFIKMIMNPGNLLLLDEPTTHLDIDSKEILLETLQNINATIVFVSHDSYFINSLATSVVYFKGKCEIVNFPGNYSEYLSSYGHDTVEGNVTKPALKPTLPSRGKIDFEQQKELRNRVSRLKKEIDEIQNKTELLEAEKSSLLEKLLSAKSNHDEILKKMAEIDELLLELIEIWEKKSEELEKLE
ncbi:MAG: ATP-binding cassette domain-containing protein [bacterium]